MADPRDDDLEAEMKDIINASTEHCADVDNDQQEDDGSQFLNSIMKIIPARYIFLNI